MKYEMLAAVDLGSNSFHLQIGRVVDEQIYLLDSFREPVRLGAGLTRERRIDRSTQLRALDALRRFGERLRGFPAGAVRAVGTNALRVAKNAEQFLAEAGSVLGHPIEVIFGREEARLIYVGVAHTLPPAEERRLVIDIGGGSTECIIGTGLDPEVTESITIGCVSFSLEYFPEGRLDKSGFKKAELAAANELQWIVKSFRRTGWKQAVGSSGTARAIAAILQANGWAEQGIGTAGLKKLRSAFIEAGDVAKLKLPGLREDRAAILPGGIAIMSAVMEEFGIDQVEVSEGALRQGVLYDLLGRVAHHDMREATVAQFARRYHVDQAQAERVGALSARLFAEMVSAPGDGDAPMLRWASALHEIGISIAHAAYHKHSAYIISQADMPGFSQAEQARLARLVLAHRGKLAKLEGLPARSADWPLIFCLRLAAMLYLRRQDVALPAIDCRATESGFQLSIARSWLDEHPLTEAALESEADEWRSLGMKLELRAVPF
ncbi:MAG: exopolyphosphatase [Betaproteobacteria bacterium]|nr:exopolyphosphatase [Betaproteobacteria bacterium]MBI2961772.1 exopolyphosphatase [Betaproteobacteria bacterium]